MPIQKQLQTPYFKRPLVIGSVILAVALIIGAAYYLQSKNNTANDAPRGVNSVDYGPPSEADKKETEAFKERQQNEANNPAPAPATANGKLAVNPVISYAGQYDALFEASAFVPTILEEGGTCTLRLTNAKTTVTKTSAGVKDAKTTRCTIFSFPSRELKPAGTWTAVVEYSSSTAAGISNKVEVEVK